MVTDYILKHRDDDVAEFKIDSSSNVEYVRIHNSEFSPVNTLSSEGSQLVSFNYWLSNRCIPNSREGIERLKLKYGIRDQRLMMLSQLGLSLSDHYWVDCKPFTNRWDSINLFDNRYNDIIGHVLFDSRFRIVDEGRLIEGHNPDLSTGGSLKKFWQYSNDDGKSYLIKDGSEVNKQEPFNELFASMLFDKLGFEHTPYSLNNIDGAWVSVCPCISDKKVEMVSADDLRLKYGFEKSYEGIAQIGRQKSLDTFTDSLNKMIIADYLVLNTDRHWQNFGILRDSFSGAWINAIPLFDNGYSLWNNYNVDPNSPSHSSSFADTNEDCLKYVDIRKYINSIPDMTSIFDKAFELYENKDRKAKVRDGVLHRQRDYEIMLDRAYST